MFELPIIMLLFLVVVVLDFTFCYPLNYHINDVSHAIQEFYIIAKSNMAAKENKVTLGYSEIEEKKRI